MVRLLSVAALVVAVGVAEGHESVCLNGEWDFKPLAEARLGEPPTEGWAEARISVPSWWTDVQFEYPPEFRSAQAAWYRRKFTVPEAWQGRRLWLHFKAAYYSTEVYVNGVRAGGHYGGFSPFTIEVTEPAKVGQNDLTVGVVGWRAAIKPEMADVRAGSTDEAPAGLIGPVGFYGDPGLWQDVFLEATGDVRIENVFVRTQVKPQPRAVATVTCVNAGDRPVRFTLRGAIRPLPLGAQYDSRPLSPRHLPPSGPIDLAPGQRVAVEMQEAPGTAPVTLWWPGKPALYHLSVSAVGEDGSPLDVASTRFGYREVTWKGAGLFINGVPIHLRGEGRCGWTSDQLLPEHIRGWYRMVGEANCNTVRLHAGKFSEEYLDIADEVGILTVVESAPLWCHSTNYAFEDERFWENSRQQLTERVLAWRNHPSLIIWSVENELLMCGGYQVKGAIERMATLGDLTKQLDPTRPVMYEGDCDPAGRADIVNLHYPYEYPRHTLWPNDAHWLSRDTGKIDLWPGSFFWRHEKPLVIGEFTNNWCSTPDWRSMWVGDTAYMNPHGKRAAYATALGMQIEGYRWAGCTGIHPWDSLWSGVDWWSVDLRPKWPDPSAPGIKPRRITSLFINPGYLSGEPLYRPNGIFQAEKRAFAPQAAFIKEYDTRFYGGETVERTVVLLNDTLEPAEMELRVTVSGAAKASLAPIRATLGPAGRAVRTFRLTFPDWSRAVWGWDVRLRLLANGKLVSDETQEWWTYDRRRGDTTGAVELVDPAGAFEPKLRGVGVEVRAYRPGPVMGELPKLIVIAPEALGLMAEAERRTVLDEVRDGARLLCLKQESYPADFLPEVKLSDVRSTICFAASATDQWEFIAEPGALSFWRGDHLVTGPNIIKPTRGPFRPLVQAGGPAGLAYTPLLEMQYGRGRIALCQMLVGEKLGRAPMAEDLLDMLLFHYLRYDEYTRPGRVVAFCEPESPLARALDDLGVAWEEVAEGQPVPDGTWCVIIGPSPSDWARALGHKEAIDRFLRDRAGYVLIQGLTPATVAQAEGLTGRRLTLRPRYGFSAVIKHDDDLLRGLSNHDLYWIASDTWNAGPVPSAEIGEYGLADLEEGMDELLTDGRLVAFHGSGYGQFVIDQVRWPEELGHERKADRYASILLQNLGVEVGVQPRVRPIPGDYFSVDLRKQCDMGFADGVAGDGTGGWTDQGKGWDMARFPTGRQVLGGVPFEIIDPAANEGRSCLVLHQPEHGSAFPQEVTGIPVGRKAGTLHFLVACAWSQTAREGDVIAEVAAHYEDGSQQVIPVRYGLEVIDWFYEPRRLPNAAPAWTGANDIQDPIALYRFAWHNPQPETTVASLDVRSLDRGPVPVLVAVTGDTGAPAVSAPQMTEIVEPLRVNAGDLELVVTPTGAVQSIAAKGQVLFSDVALRLHNNQLAGWAGLGSQWPVNDCAMRARYGRTGETTEVVSEGQLGYLDVMERATIAPDGTVMLDCECAVARAPERPELVMGLLLNLTMPEAWAGGQAVQEDGTVTKLSPEVSPANRLGAGAGMIRWQPGQPGLPSFDIGTSGRFNFLDSRLFGGGPKPLYCLQLFPPTNPTELGARFRLRATLMPAP